MIFLGEEKPLFHVPFWAHGVVQKRWLKQLKLFNFRCVTFQCLVSLVSHRPLAPSQSLVISKLDPTYLLWSTQKWRRPKSMSLCTCAHFTVFKQYHENTSYKYSPCTSGVSLGSACKHRERYRGTSQVIVCRPCYCPWWQGIPVRAVLFST